MEAVLKNLASTVELLAVAAQSDAVKRWDKLTLSRAFQWAGYCEQLFFRFHSNTTTRRIMEKQLQVTNQSLHAVFYGHNEVTFSDLSQCQRLLLSGLLNNPDLPLSIIKILFDTESPVNTTQSEYQDVTGLCGHIIQCKSACKVLSPLTDLSPFGVDAEVQGLMLTERLGVLLRQGSEVCQAERFLDSILQGCGGAAEHVCLVIGAALLTREKSQTASLDFLLDWLQRKHRGLHHMCCTLPTTVLIDLAKEHLKFRDAYYGVLKKWASDMEYNINEGEWVQTCSRTVTFQRLTEHFLALFEACPSLRENIEKELKAFKISDGDFDERGLSVWGDLLSELNK